MRRLKRLALAGSVLFTVIMILAHTTPLEIWYARWLAGNWTDPDGDILIVLAAEGQPDGLVGLASYWRATYAVRAWRQGHFRALVVAGGQMPGLHSSLASQIRDYLAANGIPREKIFLEDRSASTRENALYTRDMIAGWPGTKVLLTSEFHMFRARRVFAAVGMEVAPRPVPDILKRFNSVADRGTCFWSLSIETVKIFYYWVRGWIRL
jgi:uncharacterized SAM-binding protein YcdF (DUF218 family)